MQQTAKSLEAAVSAGADSPVALAGSRALTSDLGPLVPRLLPEVSLTAGHLWLALSILALATIVMLAVQLLRRKLIHHALSHRVGYDLLPTTSFDPSPEDIERFAAQLTRTRPAESRFRPRRGASIRIRLHTSGPDARLTYSLEGPADSDSVLRHQTYSQVELRSHEQPSGPDEPGGPPPEGGAARQRT